MVGRDEGQRKQQFDGVMESWARGVERQETFGRKMLSHCMEPMPIASLDLNTKEFVRCEFVASLIITCIAVKNVSAKTYNIEF